MDKFQEYYPTNDEEQVNHMEKKIIFAREFSLNPQEFLTVLLESTLGERRPVNDPERIRIMCEKADLILTARHQGKLVGIARSITDFTYCIYLSDLAVSQDYQKLGIGKELVKRTHAEVPEATLILLAAPKATEYYPRIGMTRHNAAFIEYGKKVRSDE